MNRFMNQSGFGTVTAIIMVAVLSAMIVVLGPMMDQTARANKQTKDELDAQYAADAGIKHVLALAKKDPSILDQKFPKHTMGENKLYEVEITPIENETGAYWITSKGTADKAHKVMKVKIKKTGESLFSKYGVYSTGKLTIPGGTMKGGIATIGTEVEVFGPSLTWLGDKVEVRNDVKVNATDSSGQYPAIEESAWINKVGDANQIGTFNMDIADSAMPNNFDTSNLLPSTSEGKKEDNCDGKTAYLNIGANYYRSKNYTLNSSQLNLAQDSVIYINGDFEMTNSSVIKTLNKKVTLYVNGDFEMNTSSAIEAEELEIIVHGKIHLTNDIMINSNKLILRNNGDLEITSNVKINAGMPDSTVLFYTKGNLSLTNDPIVIGGNAALMAEGQINTQGINAPKTILISNTGVTLNGAASLAGAYAKGTVHTGWGKPTINAEHNADIIKKLSPYLPGEPNAGSDIRVIGNWNFK